MDAKLVGKTKQGELGSGKDAKSGSGGSSGGALMKEDNALTVVAKKSGNPENSRELFSLANDNALTKVVKK